MKVIVARDEIEKAIKSYVRFRTNSDSATLLNHWCVCEDAEVEVPDRPPDEFLAYMTTSKGGDHDDGQG